MAQKKSRQCDTTNGHKRNHTFRFSSRFYLTFWTQALATYTHGFKSNEKKKPTAKQQQNFIFRRHNVKIIMSDRCVTVCCLSLDLASIYVYAENPCTFLSLFTPLGTRTPTDSSMIQQCCEMLWGDKNSRASSNKIYCCAFFRGVRCPSEKNRVGCVFVRRQKWQQTKLLGEKKSQNNSNDNKKLNWQLLFGLWIDRRQHLIAFIYSISLVWLQHGNVSCSHCHSFILSSDCWIIFFVFALLYLLCHGFFFSSDVFESGCASSLVAVIVVVYPFRFWYVCALNWYRFKITHIVANAVATFLFVCSVIFYLLWVMCSLSAYLHHKPSRLSDPKNAEQWISIFLSFVCFIFSLLLYLFLFFFFCWFPINTILGERVCV